FCAAASAATPYVPLEQRLSAEQLRETGLDTLSAEQLAALNRVLQGEAVATQAPPKAAMPLLGVDVQPIQSRLKGTITGWQEGTVFELENGQQWKVLKGYMTLPKPMQNPEVRVVPGIAGRWFLEVHEDYPKARVYLIN
ncbi:MAG: hypothetical protein ACKOXG_05130, partial [Arenimonas sp.]